MTDDRLKPGDSAPDLELTNDAGEPVRLSTLWRQSPTALFFIRHQGCPFCREHVDDLREEHDEFLNASGQVVIVTMGETHQAAQFREQHRLPFTCLADPRKEAYRAYRLPRGTVGQIYGPAVWEAGLRALLRSGVGMPRGDTKQLPGAFIIDANGIIRFAHYPQHQADRPDHHAMREVLRELQAPAP